MITKHGWRLWQDNNRPCSLKTNYGISHPPHGERDKGLNKIGTTSRN